MRVQDDEKRAALFRAAVKRVNETGFAASSVSKIARDAGVSPATLYVYHQNKEALLVAAYTEIKRDLSRAMLAGFDETRPIRETFRTVWRNMFDYIRRHPDYFQFTEQFAHSPYGAAVDREEVEGYFRPLIRVLQRGIDEQIVKNVDFDILTAFMFYPILVLANERLCRNFKATPESIETAFAMAWDAIRR